MRADGFSMPSTGAPSSTTTRGYALDSLNAGDPSAFRYNRATLGLDLHTEHGTSIVIPSRTDAQRQSMVLKSPATLSR